MAEELIMNIKSNIKSVTKDTQDLNSTLEEQKDILQDLKKEEIKLQQERAKMSDWEKSISGVDKKLEHLKFEIKDQTLAVKGLTEQQKKQNKVQKEQEQAIKGTIGNFQVFGVSLNGIKKSARGIIPLIKLMFGTIKAGLISSGIGVFVIAFGSLVTYVTSTKEGMDKLNVALAKMGAAFDVVKDRISGFGKIIGNIFSKTLSETISDVKDNFKGMGEEMSEETKQAGELEKATQKLRDIENDFLVTRAEKNKQLAEARLLSEDENTSLEVRRIALEDAIKLEKQLLQDELDHQAERVRILEEQTNMANSTAADEKALADAKVDLINLETKSLTTQKRLKREMNSLDNEILAEEKRIADEKQKIIDDEFDAMIKRNDEWNESEQARLKKLKEDAEEEIRIAKVVADAKEKIRDVNRNNVSAGIGLLKGLAGENKELQAGAIIAENAVGIARTIISTQASNAAVIAEGAALAIPTAGASVIAASGLVTANNISAGLSIGASIAATAAGLSALGTGGSVSGGGNLSSGGGATPQTPAPQMMSGAFDLSGVEAPEPVQAFVVTDDMTNSQDKLALIRRRATI